MRITNDEITFDAAEFDALSDFAKRALPEFFGKNINPDTGQLVAPFEAEFGRVLTGQVSAAKEFLTRRSNADPEIADLLKRLAAADPAVRAAAQPALDQLDAVLAAVVAPSPEPVEKEPGLFAKALNFLGL